MAVKFGQQNSARENLRERTELFWYNVSYEFETHLFLQFEKTADPFKVFHPIHIRNQFVSDELKYWRKNQI